MVLERTLSIIKPDAVAKNVIGDIYSRFEKAGLRSLLLNISSYRVVRLKVFMLCIVIARFLTPWLNL